MGKRNIGIYEKFTVSRNDGRDLPGFKHHNCQYFVLDINHDQFAVLAFKAYAEACSAENPVLSAELAELMQARQKSKVSPSTASNTQSIQCSCGRRADVHFCNKCFREETEVIPDYNDPQ